MIDITYANATQALRFEVPDSWDPIPTGVNIEVKDTNNTDILAATAATIGFTATTLNGALSVGDNSMIGTADIAASPGDRIRIAASTTGPAEIVVCKHHNASTKTTTFSPLRYAHTTGAAVNAMWFTYSLDASDADDYPVNKELLINWIPNTDNALVPQLARVVISGFDLQGIEKEFSEIYRIEHENMAGNFNAYYANAKRKVKNKLRLKNKNLDDVKDPELYREPVIEWMVYQNNKSMGGDSRVTEAKAALEAFNAAMATLEDSKIWYDEDQDDVQDEGEVQAVTYGPGIRGYH